MKRGSIRDNPFTFQGLFSLVKRNFISALITIIIFAIVGFILSMNASYWYESSALLSIPSSYFKNPAVSDVVPEMTGQSDLQGEKQAILQRALSDDFIDMTGEKYGLNNFPLDAPQHISERAKILGSIKYVPTKSSSFMLIVSASSPANAQGILVDVVEKLRYTLIEERFALFSRARNAIESEIKHLQSEMHGKRPDSINDLEKELSVVNQTIQELREKYTESHDQLYRMKKRAEELRSKIQGTDSAALDENSSEDTTLRQEGMETLYTDLMRKLSYLNVAMNMEKSQKTISYVNVIEEPNFPQNPKSEKGNNRLLICIALGVLCVLMQVVYFEYRRSQFFAPDEVASFLGVPLLGVLPGLSKQEWQLLGAQLVLIQEQKLLPPP